MPITRRQLLGLLSSGTAVLSLHSLQGRTQALPKGAPVVSFPQGVASGDPQADAIMLWTRALPANAALAEVPVLLELADDEQFEQVLFRKALTATQEHDFTLRAYVEGLQANRHYYYRFLGGDGSVSREGRTRTAPAPQQAQSVRLAFASCQSYEQAYFGAWGRMLEEDMAAAPDEQIQFVLHLGDFIYERCWHTRIDDSELSRRVPPFPDGIDHEDYRYAQTLADYRHLYQIYLSDPQLQAARARWPFICTWDDHEFANDNFQAYSTYGHGHQLEAQRKLDSNRAWFEYIPAVLDELDTQPAHGYQHNALAGDEEQRNQQAVESLRIYRRLGWGKHLDLVITDTRSYRSEPCVPDGLVSALGLPLASVKLVQILDAGRQYNDGEPPATLPYGDGSTANPAAGREAGTLLGAPQRDWFLDTLQQSRADWKVWGNSLPLLPFRLDMSSLPFVNYEDSVIGYDAWAGFPHEEGYLWQQVKARDITGLVSLSGDHHMHAAGTVGQANHTVDLPPVAADFSVAGISSSPIFEDLMTISKRDHPDFARLVFRDTDNGIEPVWNLSMLRGVLPAYTYSQTGLRGLATWMGPNPANPGLQYADTTTNGYGLASFDGKQCQVTLVSLGDCRQAGVQVAPVAHRATFTLDLWQNGEQPKLQGPEFSGGAPFPFAAPKV